MASDVLLVSCILLAAILVVSTKATDCLKTLALKYQLHDRKDARLCSSLTPLKEIPDNFQKNNDR